MYIFRSLYFQKLVIKHNLNPKCISICSKSFCQKNEAMDIEAVADSGEPTNSVKVQNQVNLDKDRTKLIPVETSIRYIKSLAYQETYGNLLVWEQYRRNHKGMYAPKKTRKMCIRAGQIATGNPCPICRDEYLILDHRNLNLLKQFISSRTGKVLSFTKTGLCQKKHLELLVAVERAMDYGLLTFDVPFREYEYSEYYPNN